MSKILCCGFNAVTFQPTATEHITIKTAQQRNSMAAAWPDGPFSEIWIPIKNVAQVFAAFSAMERLTHISNGPGFRRGIGCSHRSMPERWAVDERPEL